jgi:FAD:protein FMN transferase
VSSRFVVVVSLFAIVACEKPAPAVLPDVGVVSVGPVDASVATSTVPRAIYRSDFAMGTQITITAYTVDEGRAEQTFAAAFAEMHRLDALLTVWKPESDVSKINNAAGVEPVKVSAETIEVIERGLDGSKRTGGKFDITFGALSGLWKFDHDQDNSIPPASEIKKRLPFIGWERVRVDRGAGTVFLEKKGMKIHLGGIGKGFAVDKAVALLRAAGFRDFMVQFGGDLFVAGRHGDRAWRVGIRDPRGGPDKFFAAAEVTDATFSTSGDYERFFVKDGKRYHHILDPDTGIPAAGTRSVTIMALDATTAEWLSKGVFILGAKRGLALVESTEGAGAVIVDEKNKLHVSKRLEGKLRIVGEPTL